MTSPIGSWRWRVFPTTATTILQSGFARWHVLPTETSWRSLNARSEAPAGLLITLSEELDDPR